MKKVRLIMTSILLVLGIMFLNGSICHAASVNVSTYDELRKYLKNTSDYTITITKNITLTGEINVSGKKKLNGNGKKLTRDTKFKDGRCFDLVSGANLEISNLNITGNNVATSSNIIRVQEKSVLTLKKDVKISDAVSSIGGAAISNSGTITTAAEFRNNSSTAKGGAIKNYAGATLTVTDGKYAYNQANDGGAIYVEEKSKCNLKGGDIYRNDCTRNGEAIYAFGVTIDGAPEVSESNDIYIPNASGLVINNYTSKNKLPLYFYSDTVGTKMVAKAVKYVNNVCWSHNFKNPKNHIIVSCDGDLYVGRKIVITFHLEKDETCSTKTKTINWGEKYGTLPTPSRTGYHFVGWDVGKNVRPHITSDTVVKVDKDITLYAEWNAKVVELNFNVNGGNPLNTVWNATYNQPIYGLPKATRDGYEFVGWFNSPTGNIQYKDGDISKFATKTTLYAHWSPAKVSASLDPMGGTVKNSKIPLYFEQPYGKIETPSRPGYDFKGWSLTKDGKNIITATSKVTIKEAFILFAVWSPKSYTVQLVANGGKVENSSMKVTYGSAYGSLPEATRTGYSFKGWYSDAALRTRITEKTVVNAVKNHSLYAAWTPNKYPLVFDPNGGSITTSNKEVTYGKSIGTLPVPSRKGYVFKGWYTARQKGIQYKETTRVNEDRMVTLYARWEQIKVVSLQVKGIKEAYMVSDTIKEKDLIIKAVYNDGKRELVTDGYNIQYTNKKAGKQKVTICYKGVNYKTVSYWYDKKTMRKAIKCKNSITVYAGNKARISVSDSMKLNKYVTFVSENKKVATVSKSGKITAKKAGKTKIKVVYKVNGKKTVIAIKIKVKKPELVVSWSQKKGVLHFKAKTLGCSNVVWKSSNKKVGTIDKKTGVFKVKGQGITYINAKAGGIQRVVKIVVKNGMFECYLVS